ncbi:MAG: NUDIX domain-containing protein [Acidimicrobiales bacterium]
MTRGRRDRPERPARYAYLAAGNATQARKRVAVDLLIRDAAGNVLLVDPTYKEHWDLPGGMAEPNEAPRVAGVREVREELGLDVTAGRLLLVDWVGPHGPWDDHIVFIFDGGTLDRYTVEHLTVTDPELAGHRFVPLAETTSLLRPDVAPRLQQAHESLIAGGVAYDELDRTW